MNKFCLFQLFFFMIIIANKIKCKQIFISVAEKRKKNRFNLKEDTKTQFTSLYNEESSKKKT